MQHFHITKNNFLHQGSHAISLVQMLRMDVQEAQLRTCGVTPILEPGFFAILQYIFTINHLDVLKKI